jgi:hypothetical protein
MIVIRGSLVASLALSLPGIALLACATTAARDSAVKRPDHQPPRSLSGGAPSLEALIDEFLAAIEERDKEALHRLRLTKEEYTEIIVPGEVPKGQPPRQTFTEVNDVFWGILDTKSRYVADMLVSTYGGRHYVDRRLELTKGTREWAWYTGHGELRLTLSDAAGEEVQLRSGWIAEVGGRYKFIGFNWRN